MQLRQLHGLLARATMIRVLPAGYDDAAALFRTCRREGVTVRRLIDCLIAAVALRRAAPILHADADFSALARRSSLREHPASRS